MSTGQDVHDLADATRYAAESMAALVELIRRDSVQNDWGGLLATLRDGLDRLAGCVCELRQDVKAIADQFCDRPQGILIQPGPVTPQPPPAATPEQQQPQQSEQPEPQPEQQPEAPPEPGQTGQTLDQLNHAEPPEAPPPAPEQRLRIPQPGEPGA